MLVLFSGPEIARPYMDAVADALGGDEATILRCYGVETPDACERWPEVGVLFTVRQVCSDALMARAPALRAIVTPTIGLEGIDTEAARRRGISIGSGRAPENFESVAEAAVLFILMALYQVHAAEARLRSGTPRSGQPTARMLKGKTVGVIGFGDVAKSLVLRLQGWGVRILVCNRSPVSSFANVFQCDLEALLRDSDIVLPMSPLHPQTEGLLSRSRLLQMRNGAVLVNLSRGAIIEEAALSDPEVVAHLGAIALDVFAVEPLPPDSPLRAWPGAILTNHEIALTEENVAALLAMAVANLRAAITGRPMPCLQAR